MTLYAPHDSPAVIADDFLVIDRGNERYDLCEVTLEGQSATPNIIPWGRCYTLGPNKSLMLFPDRMLFIVDGQRAAVMEHYWTVTSWPNLPGCCKYSMVQSFWPQIMTYLEEISTISTDAEMVWRAMKEWEIFSGQVLQWLENNLGKFGLSRDTTEIVISGTRWLAHCHSKGQLVAGNARSVWGKTIAPQEYKKVRLATPTKEGWIVKTEGKDWLLQHKGNGVISLREIVCPVGRVKRFGSWLYWQADNVILTPMGRLVAIPCEAIVHGATPRWAIAPDLDKEWVIINQEGTIYTKKAPRQYNDWTELSAGDGSVLVVHEKNRHCYFSMIPDSNLPSLRHSWQTVVFPRWEAFVVEVGVIRGNPDIFVVLFRLLQPTAYRRLGICLISANGEAWLSFSPFEVPGLLVFALFEEHGNGQVTIRLLGTREGPTEIKIGVLNNFVQLDMGGVTVTGQMTRLSQRKSALWERFRSLLESQAN